MTLSVILPGISGSQAFKKGLNMGKIKNLIWVALAIALLFATVGAVTLTNSGVAGAGFVINGTSSDFTGTEIIKAGTASLSIYLERLYISSESGVSWTASAGDLGASGATTTILGPVYVAANTTTEFVFTRPIKLSAASPFVVSQSVAGNGTVIAQGFIRE